MATDKCPLEPNPLYRDFAGVFPDPKRRASGSWVMRYKLNLGSHGRPTIQGEPGTQEFADNYHKAKAAAANGSEPAQPAKVRKVELQAGETGKGKSLDWLIAVYMGSPQYESLGARMAKAGGKRLNQVQRRRYLEAFANALTPGGRRFGAGPFEEIEKRHVELWLNTVKPVGRHKGSKGRKGGKSVRDAHLGAVRVLYNWAHDRGLYKLANPAGRVEATYKSEGTRAILADDLTKLRKRWPEGMERLAIEVLFATGARRSDVHLFGDHMVGDDGVLRWTQTKGSESDFPGKHAPKVMANEFDMNEWPELRAMIKSEARRIEADTGVVPFPRTPQATWLRNPSGRPFGYGNFGKWWRGICRAAGVKEDLNMHSMRAGHAVMMFEASGGDLGATSASLGHARLATTELYLRDRNKAALAKRGRAALRKVAG